MISDRRLERMAQLAFSNVLRLHRDAIALFNLSSFPSAKFLAIHALEELGKVLLLGDLLYDSRTGALTEGEIERSLLDLHNHRKKQFRLRRESPPFKQPLLDEARSGALERAKQDSVYVGLARRGKGFDPRKPIRNPLRVSRRQAEAQISEVNDFVIDLVAGVLLGIYMLDTQQAQRLINKALLTSLVKAWPPQRVTTRRLVERLELQG